MAEISSIPRSVLIVDDVVEIQQLVAHWLEPRGHRVWRASTGREALRSLAADPCDLVIVDVLMPDGDGLDVIREVRAKTPSVRLLAISGGGRYMAAPECIRLAQGMGAHAVLLKPFKDAELLAAMDRALNAPA